MEKTMDKIVALAKARGFVYPGSEIYGGLANTWDYGNLGVELKNNVKKAWWQKFVQENPYNVGVDCAILMNPQTWVASGHLGGFSDPLMDCKECHERFRADKLIEDFCAEIEKLEDTCKEYTGYDIAKYYRIYSFPTLNAVTILAQKISSHYFGKSYLYKDEVDNCYYLVLYVSDHTAEEFNRICNVLSEYATPIVNEYATLSYFTEHFKLILKDNAIQTLSEL